MSPAEASDAVSDRRLIVATTDACGRLYAVVEPGGSGRGAIGNEASVVALAPFSEMERALSALREVGVSLLPAS